MERLLKLEQTLMSLFGKYSSTFFHERTINIHALSLTERNSLCHHNLRLSSDKYICDLKSENALCLKKTRRTTKLNQSKKSIKLKKTNKLRQIRTT